MIIKRLISCDIIYVMQNTKRTALLIRCSVEEADRIRASAAKERRTISAHVLKIVMPHIALREQFAREHNALLRERGLLLPEET